MDKIIGGRYEIASGKGALIGEGGMGKVYRGKDVQTGSTVAVKLLAPQMVKHQPQMVERFAREAEALSRLDHPNIVNVLATINEDNYHFLVMEYVGGGSLRELLNETSQLPVERVLDIGTQLADALSLTHNLGIIHRDIKPGNVLLKKDGTPRLTDFGVARIGDRTRMTSTGIVVGTIKYLSPESLNGEALDERTDIWSLGVMLYEMLAGQHPFAAENSTLMIRSILTNTVPELENYRLHMPPGLELLLLQMLAKDCNQRIGNMNLVGMELEKISMEANTKTLQIDANLLKTVVHEGNLQPIRDLLKDGDKDQARVLLRPVLKWKPTADAWYLAAQASNTREQAIKCLRRALEVDEWHAKANRMLHKLEGAKPVEQRKQGEVALQSVQPLKPVERQMKKADFQKRAERRRMWSRVGIAVSIVISILLILGLLGALSGFIGTFTVLFGGPQPVYEIQGTPIEELADAPMQLTPAMSSTVQGETMGIIGHGYLHEYTFEAVSQASYSITVNFVSLNARRVSRNVVLVDPYGGDATAFCRQPVIQESDTSVSLICLVDETGIWSVRVLGRWGESVGVYSIGVERYMQLVG